MPVLSSPRLCKFEKKRPQKMGEDCYGDWFCPPCTGSIFPFSSQDINLNIHPNENKEFKTFTDCSSCSKQVKGEGMCCGLCKHWNHKKCIGKFSNKRPKGEKIDIGSFENMNEFYKDTDWFCYKCSRSIFPFLSLKDEDFLITCSEFDKNVINNNLQNSWQLCPQHHG